MGREAKEAYIVEDYWLVGQGNEDSKMDLPKPCVSVDCPAQCRVASRGSASLLSGVWTRFWN